jgi:predicted outer membrane lipoprotein
VVLVSDSRHPKQFFWTGGSSLASSFAIVNSLDWYRSGDGMDEWTRSRSAAAEDHAGNLP